MWNVREQVSAPFTAAFISGGVAGAVSRTVVSPLERLKILYQIQSAGREEYKLSIWRALKKMWTDEGWRGFMRGNGTNCIRIIPYSAVQFGSYNIYKRVCRIFRPDLCPRRLTNHSSPNHRLAQTFRLFEGYYVEV
jgi:solute carrier family 25 phosphate transporter 23/24/25/41